jgi:hypothetical protein
MSCLCSATATRTLPEARLDVLRLGRPELTKPSSQALDLTGKAKAIMAIGLGATGKTTLLRWLCERGLERNDDDLALATVDPVNRELGHYFPAAMAPHTQDPAQVTVWLEQLLAMIMESRKFRIYAICLRCNRCPESTSNVGMQSKGPPPDLPRHQVPQNVCCTRSSEVGGKA